MKVYISGAITNNPDYKEDFYYAERYLRNKGFEVINPADISQNMPKSTTYKQYMELSLCLLNMCDVMYIIDGWEGSKGVMLEKQFAETMGIPIIEIPVSTALENEKRGDYSRIFKAKQQR